MSGKEKETEGNPVAVHLSDDQGTGHVVGIGNLRVFLVKEEGVWYAQGLEIDYLAQGNTIQEAKKSFEVGLTATIHENLELHGTIEPVLKVAPQEIWKEIMNPGVKKNKFTQVSIHQIESLKPLLANLPFEGIDYLERTEVA